MQVNYSAAWVECKALAEAVNFSDIAAKQVIRTLLFLIDNFNVLTMSVKNLGACFSIGDTSVWNILLSPATEAP